MKKIMIAAALAVLAANAIAEDVNVQPQVWTYFDHDGEEVGWANASPAGETIAVIDCEFVQNKDYYRFFTVGLFEEYTSSPSQKYWLSTNTNTTRGGEVYVSTTGGYYEYIYSFAVDAETVKREEPIELCVRAHDDNSDGKCEKFSGTNLRKVVADLCVPKAPAVAEDPRKEIVEAFYLALEAGDGPRASALVVPEKRVKGPFSASELSRFYGNLKKPLRLISISKTSAQGFRVRYTFENKNGLVCDGASFVTVSTSGGGYLISKIRTETGC